MVKLHKMQGLLGGFIGLPALSAEIHPRGALRIFGAAGR
jgi:hypothetical protein